MDIGLSELRDHAAAVIEAVNSGKHVTVTVRGEPVADIVPHVRRERWLSGATLRKELERRAADAGLSVELNVLS